MKDKMADLKRMILEQLMAEMQGADAKRIKPRESGESQPKMVEVDIKSNKKLDPDELNDVLDHLQDVAPEMEDDDGEDCYDDHDEDNEEEEEEKPKFKKPMSLRDFKLR